MTEDSNQKRQVIYRSVRIRARAADSAYLGRKIRQTPFAVVDGGRDLEIGGDAVVLRPSSPPRVAASPALSVCRRASGPSRWFLEIVGRRGFAGILHGGHGPETGLGWPCVLPQGRHTLVGQPRHVRGQQRIAVDVGPGHLPGRRGRTVVPRGTGPQPIHHRVVPRSPPRC
jgi:hypothetical protein